MGLDFKETGLPRGYRTTVTNDLYNANGENGGGFTGKDIYITAVTNSTGSDTYVTLYDLTGGPAGQQKVPQKSATSFPTPLGPFKNFYIPSNHYPTDGVAVFYVLVDKD